MNIDELSDEDIRRLRKVITTADFEITVVFSSDATTGIGFATIDGESYTWSASAKVDPLDDFDREVAIKLTVGRVLEKASKQLLRQAEGRVKNIDDNRKQSAAQKAARLAEVKPVKKTRKLTRRSIKSAEANA